MIIIFSCQAILYNSRTFCPGIKDADLLMMQIIAALYDDIDNYLVALLAKFKLAKWASGDIDTDTSTRSEDFIEHCNGLADQFLGLMISLTSERWSPGVGVGQNNR